MCGLLLLLLFQPQYDLLIRNARIVDGAGNPWFRGDVAIMGDRIAAVGKMQPSQAKKVLDAQGLLLAPGFIDTHSHAISGIYSTPSAENLIRQGVTSLIEGPDGSSPIPLKPALDRLGSTRIGVNFGFLMGHGSIRSAVIGSENRAPTATELQRMKDIARQAMLDGAFGMSTGLFYVPGNYAATAEVIEIARVVGELGGVHTSHMRDEGDHVLESVKETIRIGEEGHLPTQVTHHKIVGLPNWGKTAETLKLIDEARARGVDVTVDAYPYTASSTGLGASLVPQWARAGGSKALFERLDSPGSGQKVRAGMVENLKLRGGPERYTMASCRFDASLAGKTLAQVAGSKDPVETAIELIRRGDCSVVSHAISEEDIERVLRYPFTMIASDGFVPVFGRDVPHPRSYGTFARVLAQYVREKKVLTLEDAIHKMSGLPAQRFSIYDRGLIRPGMKADLVLFDPDKIQDKATYAQPHQYAVGVDSVWVNGVLTLEHGKMTGELSGRPLYGPAYKQ